MNFVSFAAEKIFSNHVLFLFQVTAVIDEIERSTQCDLNFIFYEISEYVNFFLLKCFLPKNKLLVNTNFVKTRLHVNAVTKNYGVSR